MVFFSQNQWKNFNYLVQWNSYKELWLYCLNPHTSTYTKWPKFWFSTVAAVEEIANFKNWKMSFYVWSMFCFTWKLIIIIHGWQEKFKGVFENTKYNSTLIICMFCLSYKSVLIASNFDRCLIEYLLTTNRIGHFVFVCDISKTNNLITNFQTKFFYLFF